MNDTESERFTRNPSVRDITWILELKSFEQLDLDPPYQRRSVWSTAEKRQFLDTIFNEYPSPAIFLHRDYDHNGRATYHVVDGKQRLSTILEFSRGELKLGTEIGDSRLAGKAWNDLTDLALKKRFWEYQLVIEMVKDISEPVIKEVFERLNKNSRKLNRQEMRHARFDGWLIRFLESTLDAGIWNELRVSTPARSRRMLDVQTISELAEVTIRREVQGFNQDRLDEFFASYEDPSDQVPEFDTDTFEERFVETASFVTEVQRANKELGLYLPTIVHLYPFWAYIELNDLAWRDIDVAVFARTYSKFMHEVDLVRGSTDASQNVSPHAIQYAAGSSGATTDLRKRRERFDALAGYFQDSE